VFSGPNVGNIRDPFGIGGRRGEVSVQMILRACRTNSRALHSPQPSLQHSLQPCPTHQPRHAVTATALPGVAEVLPDPLAPHDAVLVSMELTNLRE
jgi:hypothetical protein